MNQQYQQMSEKEGSVTMSDYNKVIDYVPVRKKHQLIIPFDFNKGKYLFTENDLRYLYKQTEDMNRVKETVNKIQSDQKLNPNHNYRSKILKIFLHGLHVLSFFIFLYIFLGIFIFFLGDPVICFLYVYFVFFQFWWRGGKVGIEILKESRRSKPLESYLKSENKKYYVIKNLKWSVGGNGKWIQVDDLKYSSKQNK